MVVTPLLLAGCSPEVKESFNKGFEAGKQTAQGTNETTLDPVVEKQNLQDDLRQLRQAFTDLKEQYSLAKQRGDKTIDLEWNRNFNQRLTDLRSKYAGKAENSNDPYYQPKMAIGIAQGDLTTLNDEYLKALEGKEHDYPFFEKSIDEGLQKAETELNAETN